MRSGSKKVIAFLVCLALLLSFSIVPNAESTKNTDSVESSFAASLGLSVGETYIDADYSADGATVTGWSAGSIGTGQHIQKKGIKLRNINGSKETYYEVPNTNFVAKFTVYHTATNMWGLRFGSYDNTASTLTYAWHGNSSQWWFAKNYFRCYGAANGLAFTLGDAYDTTDQTKPITIYIFSYNGTVRFVGTDGVEYLSYEAVADKIYLNANYCELIMTEFSLKELKEVTNPNVTYSANGGMFSNGECAVNIAETIGGNLTAEIPNFENHRFLGWSTTPDGEALNDITVTADLNGKTLYAVWQKPYPTDGNYTTGSVIDVDFSNWVLAENNNSYSGKDKDNNTVYFFSDKQTENGDGANDTYIRLDTTKITSTVPGFGYLPNFALTMTDNGKTTDELILPNDTTFKLTMRVRINELNGSTAELRVFYSYQKACQSGNNRFNDRQTLVSGIEETNGEWVDIVTYFTTPKKYTDNSYTSGNICDKVYIALGPSTSALVQYDITNVKLEYASKANLYYDKGGETELYTTLYGEPGSALTFPKNTTEEFYSSENSQGGIITYNFESWYLDKDYTEAAPAKFGNVDTSFYTKDTSSSYSSTENQDGYCGFDTYGQSYGGVSIDNTAAKITNTEAYTGNASMLVTKDTAFEIRNENAINVIAGKTYNISFYYKSASNLSVGIGVGKANALPSTASAVKTIKLNAANEWTKALITLTLPYGTTDGYALALIADVTDNAYFDNIIVSSVASSVGAEKSDDDLRFMFTYDTAVELSDSTLVIEDQSYTVTERGILVKDSENSAELIKENFGKNGVVGTVLTNLENYYTYNSVTGAVVYSVRVDGAALSDNFTARGYVVLNNGTVYYTDLLTSSLSVAKEKIKTIPKTVSFNSSNQTAYVYLPEGTILSEDLPEASFYNDLFIADNTVVSNNLMQKGGFVSFAEEVNCEKITIPAELYYTVEIGAKAQLYYGVDASLVTKQLSAESKDNVNYIFITDIHYSGYGTEALSKEERDGAIDRQMERIVKMANENEDIDFVVVGGDLTTGQYNSAEGCLNAASKGIEPLKKCAKPVFVLMGNHDDNSYGTDTRASNDESFVLPRIVSDKYWNERILNVYSPNVVHDTNHQDSKYYYYDIENKKTRIICLDSSDKEEEYDENGVVTGLKLLDSSKSYICTQYKTGYSYWGYSERQLKWLATEALAAEDGWNYIFVSHMGNGGDYYYAEDLTELMTAYQNKTAYSFEGEEISFNVNFNDGGKILSYQHGHVHAGSYKYLESVGIWKINTETANYRNAADEDEANRIYQTNSEALFDLMSVNEEAVHQMRIGSGKNTKFYNSP